MDLCLPCLCITLGGNGQPSLKIDPRALLPGQKPPPRRTPPKEEKPDPESTVLSPGPKEIPAWPMEKSVGFDQPTLSNATLSSVNKVEILVGIGLFQSCLFPFTVKGIIRFVYVTGPSQAWCEKTSS